ncbi:MAG: putative toxin-antitoxin system toxin component, PIN family [candidate division NC10 bacterium]|nr:putative toxin-antitoxin system toxin component, PIN family [candidate division NC10 bacterium]
MIRAVLDTNVILSALLFGGSTGGLVRAWQTGWFQLLLSRALLEEILRVLAYPKFHLTEGEIRGLLEEELIPFAETVIIRRQPTIQVRDPDDLAVAACALTGRARYLVTGDADLLSLGRIRQVDVIRPADFLALLGPPSPGPVRPRPNRSAP